MAHECANFRLVLFVDGMEDPIDVSTEGEDGGFLVSIFQRDGGYATTGFEISGHREGDTLVIEVRNKNGIVVATSRTVR